MKIYNLTQSQWHIGMLSGRWSGDQSTNPCMNDSFSNLLLCSKACNVLLLLMFVFWHKFSTRVFSWFVLTSVSVSSFSALRTQHWIFGRIGHTIILSIILPNNQALPLNIFTFLKLPYLCLSVPNTLIISQFCQIVKECLLLKCGQAVSEWWKDAIFELIDWKTFREI